MGKKHWQHYQKKKVPPYSGGNLQLIHGSRMFLSQSVISIIPVLIVYFFTQKQFTDSIATLGIKG